MLTSSHLSFITRRSFGIENRDKKVWTDKYFFGIAAPLPSITITDIRQQISPECGLNIANSQSAAKSGGCQSKEFISCRNSTHYYPAIIIPFLLCLSAIEKILAAVWRLQPSDNLFCSQNTIYIQNFVRRQYFDVDTM